MAGVLANAPRRPAEYIFMHNANALRICLDAHMIAGRETGNETYIAALATALAQLPGVRCLAALEPDAVAPDEWPDGQPELVRLRPPGDWLRLGYTLPRICSDWHADLLHVTYNAPFVSPCPVVVTVHDVIFRRYPNFFSARDRLLFATLLPLSLRQAAAIITVSQRSRADIEQFYPFTVGKVHVVPEAPGRPFRWIESPDAQRAICERYGIKPGFILAVGNLQPRKNLGRLVAAFRSLLSSVDQTHQLVLVGKDGLRSDEFRSEVRDLIESGRLVLTGYVPTADLPVLYSAAAVFVYAPIYEGFGLPPLEAMACGCPVVTSNTSSLPEVVGSAAIRVDPYDVPQIADAMLRVIEDQALATNMREQGLERARLFSWRRCAQETVAAYGQCAQRA